MALINAETQKKVRIKPGICSVVIAAAGSSVRMGEADKIFAPLDAVPIIVKTISAFEKCELVGEIVVVARQEKLEEIKSLCGEYKLDKVAIIVLGGGTRLESVSNGVFSASRKYPLIAVHDGARPLVSTELIETVIKKAAEKFAAIPAVKVSSTLKEIKNGVVVSTMDRENVYDVQTPQVFLAEVIKAAVHKGLRSNAESTDESMALEAIGFPVHVVDGEKTNIKITTPEDIKIAEAIISAGKSAT